MRISILGINYAPEIISTGIYTSGLAEKLAEYGHDVSVIAGQPYYPEWRVFDGYPKYWYLHRTTQDDLNVAHCPHYVPAKPTGIKRILHQFSFALTSLPIVIWQCVKTRPEIYIAVAPSLLSAPIAWAAARLTGAKCWLHVQDLEVEAAFASGLLRKNTFFGRCAKRYERWILKRFDKISSISPPMIAKLRQKTDHKIDIVELRNWADFQNIWPIKREESLKPVLGIESKFVALYSGNIGRKQGIEIIPKVAKILTHRPDITFVICGNGPYLDQLKVKAKGMKNVVFIPLQPVKNLNGLLGMADVHLLPQIESVADLVLPSKLTNMLASGRPIIATADPNSTLAAEIQNCGLITPPENAQAFADRLIALLADQTSCNEMGRNARTRAIEKWDKEQILEGFERQIISLVKQSQQTQNTVKTAESKGNKSI